MAFLDNYLDIVTSEHRARPKFIAMLTALLRQSDDIFALAITMDDEFDLSLATGKQEDILGEIVGQNRRLPYIPKTTGQIVCDNETYRILLKAKVIQNIWKGGIMDGSDAWRALFGFPIRVRDNQDMTITVLLDDNLPRSLIEHITHGMIVPKPQSVRVNAAGRHLVTPAIYVGAKSKIKRTVHVYPASQTNAETDSALYIGMAAAVEEIVESEVIKVG